MESFLIDRAYFSLIDGSVSGKKYVSVYLELLYPVKGKWEYELSGSVRLYIELSRL